MVFKRKQLNNGEIDPNINLNGRIDGRKAEPPTNREVRNREFISLIRKLKPHLSSSVKTVMEIIESEDSSDQNKLKAAALVIQMYKELVKDVYDQQYDEQEGVEIQPANTPKFSLTMISGGKEVERE